MKIFLAALINFIKNARKVVHKRWSLELEEFTFKEKNKTLDFIEIIDYVLKKWKVYF